MSTSYAFTFRENATGEGTLYVVDDAGAPIDLTGCDLRLEFRDHEVDGNVLIELTKQTDGTVEGLYFVSAVGGAVGLRIEAETLQGIPDATGDFDMWFDLLVTRPDGTTFVPGGTGRARVLRGITFPAEEA